MRKLWIAGLSLTLLGCATAPASPSAEASRQVLVEEVRTPVAGNSDLICTTGRFAGSHIARRECFTRAEYLRIAQASQEWIRSGGSRGAPYLVRDTADPRDGGAGGS